MEDPMRRQRMRCRRGGGGRDGGGRSAGSRPPLSIHDTSIHPPPASNEAQFHFTSAMVRPRITATISISFQEEPQDEGASSSRKRWRKSTIPTHQPQDTRKSAALPVKSGSMSSSSNGVSSDNSSQHSNGVDDDPEDYGCPIVEENPPTHIDS